jgi:tetratricopeptide (TPR) repeat protein
MLANVEFNHFPPMTELLVKPRFRTFIDDIGYALERWPNHHRALVTVMRLSQRLNTERPENADRPVECWFERAARFAPDDPVVRGLYAEFLTQRKRTPEAVEQLQFLEKHAKDSAFTHYNIELLYLSIGRHEDALKHAHVASALGLTNIQGLRDKLAAQGHWRDPPDAASTGAAAAAGALPPAAAASSSP